MFNWTFAIPSPAALLSIPSISITSFTLIVPNSCKIHETASNQKDDHRSPGQVNLTVVITVQLPCHNCGDVLTVVQPQSNAECVVIAVPTVPCHKHVTVVTSIKP